LVGKTFEKWPLGRPETSWEDNIKIYIRQVVMGGEWNWTLTWARWIWSTPSCCN